MDVDVIIVSYNTHDLLRAALRSVAASAVRPASVIVVDNASSDCSAEMVEVEFPEVILVRAESNLGFARANNLGMEQSRAEYELLLNSDVEIGPDTIEVLLREMSSDPAIGAVGPVLRGADGRVQFEGGRRDPSILGEFSNITHLNRVVASGPLTRYMINDWDHLSSRDVEVLSGACMLVRRSALDSTLFRTDFFMYGEDVELCQRLRAGGSRLRYVAETEVLHHGGASSRQARLKMRVAGVVSMAQLFVRSRGPLYALGYLLIVPIAWPIGAIVKRVSHA